MIKITYDPAKSEANVEERGLSFERVHDFEWETAIFKPAALGLGGEERFRIFAMLDNRLHLAVITPRDHSFRVISLRKANRQERNYYAEEKTKSFLD